jgi:hypothetical protein
MTAADGSTGSVPSAQHIADLSRTLGRLTQLRVLDGIWTAAAQAASKEEGSARSTQVTKVTAVVHALDAAFQELASLAPRLEPIFAKHADMLQEGTDKILDATPGSARSKMREILATKGDLAEAARDTVSRLPSTASDETAKIRTEVGKLYNGATSAGDFSQQTEVELGVLAASASVLLGPEAGIAIEAVAHGAEAAVSLLGSLWDWLTG